ncbi:MAG TPA: NAD(P)/FAD-dependent oxidoreductase [Polyangia bacterium]|jgi:L-2-hydroxyglutarate oxidase LhgO|nr:NAD(P)/FAD-dependent oxidoreductase [Polyangia bacterium]
MESQGTRGGGPAASGGEALDVVVIGAGVVGLAVARALALAGREVVVLESATAIGTHTSSRNSEVIHAGLYYPTGSRKARLCVAGRDALYRYCAENDVAHRRIGKLLVATVDAEIAALESYKKQAELNGVMDLTWLDANQAHALEPAVRAVRALLSPSTGIVDSHGLMQALQRDLTRLGGSVVLGSPVLGGEVHGDGITLRVGGEAPTQPPTIVRCRGVVNSAGLFAQAVARSLDGLPPASIPPCHYAKGHYFVLAQAPPFRRLVYPVAVAGGLGVHVTLDLGGRARFGPDVSWVDGIDYAFDESRAPSFYAAIRRYWPDLRDGDLQPGYTGIRPKLGPAGTPAADFVIQGPSVHGVHGLVNLYGIESPGLTASLAIAEEVAELLAM